MERRTDEHQMTMMKMLKKDNLTDHYIENAIKPFKKVTILK
jgi:hypothetical protein